MKRFFAVVAVVLFFAVATKAETTNELSDKEIQGRELVQKILNQWPSTNSYQTGTLKIRDKNGEISETKIRIGIRVTETNWQTFYSYDTHLGESNQNTQFIEKKLFSITRTLQQTNQYRIENSSGNYSYFTNGNWAMVNQRVIDDLPVSKDLIEPLGDSDFWLCDLGLEFFHWPSQKVLKREVHSSRGCTVLESTNPDPTTNSYARDVYSRVVCWIDTETLGIVEAYAYDAKGKELKIFTPKDFKKVNGQWQVQTFLMENVQTGSRSRLEFDLKK